MLGGAGVAAAFTSDWFVSALTPATHAMHMSQDFAGLVVVAIAGNAVENVVGVQLAARNRPDFAISVIVNSALQVALLLTPLLVFVSLFFATLADARLPDAARDLAAARGGNRRARSSTTARAPGRKARSSIGLYVVIAASFWWGA